MDTIDLRRLEKACPLSDKDSSHTHCSGCSACPGPGDDLPKDWYSVCISRGLMPRDTDPTYMLCPGCMVWQWEVLGVEDPELDRIRCEIPNREEALEKTWTRAITHLADKAMEERYTTLLKRDPGAVRYFRRRGRIRRTRGNISGALSDFTRAIELEKSASEDDWDSEARVSLAKAYLERGLTHLQVNDLEKAEADLDQSFFACPNLTFLSAPRARLYQLRGVTASAEACLEDARREAELPSGLVHESWRLLICAQELLKKNDDDAARGCYAEAIFQTELATMVNPSVQDGHLVRGLALASVHRYEEAETAILKEIELRPDYEKARMYLARVRARKNGERNPPPIM